MDNIMDGQLLAEVLRLADDKKVKKLMAEALRDSYVKTDNMFENIVKEYIDADDEFRKGMCRMFEILTWMTLEGFVEEVADTCLKAGEGE